MTTSVRVEWTKDSGGRWKMEEVPGSQRFFPAQLVFLALGFLGPQSEVIHALGVKQDGRSNIQTPAKVRRMTMHLSGADLFLEICNECGRYFRGWGLSPWTIAHRLGYQVSDIEYMTSRY